MTSTDTSELPVTGSARVRVLNGPTISARGHETVEALPVSTTGTSASAAFARSLFLFMGFMFRRPSKLFRPSKVDTWAGLRQLALSANQNLSPSFIRSLMNTRSGALAMLITIIPPLAVNTAMGFLLFTSHSFFSLELARMSFFRRHYHPDAYLDHLAGVEEEDGEEDPINLQTLISGPRIIPNHPTLLSGLAGAGAGLVQGAAFTPIENIVRLLHGSATSLTALLPRLLHLPTPLTLTQTQNNLQIPTSPHSALRTFLSSDTWRKSPSWWTGWRWSIARDALSYGCFFAAFDITRRLGLRVKGLFGGGIQSTWGEVLVLDLPIWREGQGTSSPEQTPTIARIAQAGTIVTGGVMASLLAEFSSRPFRACQKIMSSSGTTLSSLNGNGKVVRLPNPIIQTLRAQGIRPFLYPDDPPQNSTKPVERSLRITKQGRVGRLLTRVGWRMAAVGPWGFGFLVWAWVGGEV